MTPRRAIIAGTIVAIAIAVTVGGYSIGHSSGEDLTAAADRGTKAGRINGAEVGTKRGYHDGFRAGRQRAYGKSYVDSYRDAYRAAYEKASLDPPNRIEVPSQ